MHMTKHPLSRSILVGWLIGSLSACTPTHYRQQADCEARQLINEKSTNPRWAQCNLDVYGDPRARFYDGDCPDKSPMPKDDDEANRFMKCVYGLKGSKRWWKNGVREEIENPGWRELLGDYARMNEDGEVDLDLATACRLGRIHSPGYQRNLEEVYLAALDVAFERFRFDVQFFGGNTTTGRLQGNEPRAVIGALAPGGKRSSQSVIDTTTSLDITKRFATGADLLIGFANSFVWNFSGPDTGFATSLIDFSLLQPLLRNGGRYVVLEQLTRAERSLLANLRSMSQYRDQFYLDIAVGTGVNLAPRRIGGFQGGAGLSGFTGTGAGGFGGVGSTLNNQNAAPAGGSGAGGGAGLAGGGEGTLNGYFGLVQRVQALRNTRTNLAAQRANLGLLESNAEAGLIDLVQVDEFRQNIETERASLIRNEAAQRTAIERFLSDVIGLPPNLPIDIDDTLVRQFQLIDAKLELSQTEVADLIETISGMNANNVAELAALVGKLDQFIKTGHELLAGLKQEMKELAEGGDSKTKAWRTQEQKEVLTSEIERLSESNTNLQRLFDRDQQQLEALQARMKQPQDRPKEIFDSMIGLTRTIASHLQEVSLLQAGTRVQKVVVEPIDITSDMALQVASTTRLDWMTRRSALVDQWRLIAFNANRLKARLDIAFDGEIGTIRDNPVSFRASTGNLRARLIFDAPITRVSERNLYRESLIEYQRARRTYIQFVDNIHQAIRTRLRDLGRLRQNLEIQRKALAIAIRRVDQTREDLNEPAAAAAEPGQRASAQLSPILAQNLLRALSDLRNTQDNFMSVWLAYESFRMQLRYEMGILRFDENGLFVDEPIDVAISQILAHECDESFEPPILEAPEMEISTEPVRLISHFEPVETIGPNAEPGPTATPPAPAASTRSANVKEKSVKFTWLEWFKRPGDPLQELNPDPAGREKFPTDWRKIVEMSQQGLNVEQISRKMKLKPEVVRAHLRSYELAKWREPIADSRQLGIRQTASSEDDRIKQATELVEIVSPP